MTKGKEVIQGEVVEAQTDAQVQEEAKAIARRPSQADSILSVIKDAVASKADVAVMRELLAIRREERADLAREAFAEALVQFRTLVKPIIMTGKRDDTKTRKRDGGYGSVKYSYAELTTTIEQIQGALDTAGLTPTWRMTKSDPNYVELECVVTHTLGHKESSMPLGAPPQGAGGQTPVQQRIGTITTLKRATLFMVLGLTTKEDDRNLKQAEQGVDQAPSETQQMLDQPEDELQAKARFRKIADEKAGSALSNSALRTLLNAVQEAGGGQTVSECCDWLSSISMHVGRDGSLIEATEGPDASGFEEYEQGTAGEVLDGASEPRCHCIKCGVGITAPKTDMKGLACPKCGSKLGFKD